MKEIYIAGCGLSKFGKRNESLEEIMCEAAASAMKEENCDSFDAVYVGAMNPEDFTGESDISSVELEPFGVVLSFTTLYVTTENFIPPVILILVELIKSKTKLLCTGAQNLKIDIGDIVEIEETTDGKYIAKPCPSS
ncbi:MAG TPA: hypothetical protein DCX95_06745 [Elusimicrobia bacterium]|nr:hypothetical protein [Elusimicrobiota bacterium]